MPTLENTVPVISRKYLTRKADRSAVVVMSRRAAFMGNAIPRLERAQRTLHERLLVLREPVQRIDKQGNVVTVQDDDALIRVIKGLIDVIEAERCLLGFPSPGRRRNEGEHPLKDISAPGVIDAEEPQAPVQAQASAGEQAGEQIASSEQASSS